jgi:hypothetical protein
MEGKPLYFAKTSGTTDKYIPLTKNRCRIILRLLTNAILHYIHETGKADFVDGKNDFLGSPF